MIKKLEVSTGGETYDLDFQVLRFGDPNRSCRLLLDRPWLKLSNAVTDWAKGCITYESRDNRTKVGTKPRNSKRAEHEVDSSSNYFYDSNGDANDSYYAKFQIRRRCQRLILR